MEEITGISQAVVERPINDWEKQSKKDFIRRMVFFSGMGQAIGGVLVLGAGIFLFINFWGDAPMPPGYVAPPMPLQGALIIASMIGLASGLPLGFFQWTILGAKFNRSQTIVWIPVYCFGLISSIFLGLVIEEYLHQDILALIIALFMAGCTIALVQWLILRKYISRGYLLILLNLVGILLLVLCFYGGLQLNRWIYCVGSALGSFLGGSIYGGILALGIVFSLRKGVLIKM